jgi:hypothetical protein
LRLQRRRLSRLEQSCALNAKVRAVAWARTHATQQARVRRGALLTGRAAWRAVPWRGWTRSTGAKLLLSSARSTSQCVERACCVQERAALQTIMEEKIKAIAVPIRATCMALLCGMMPFMTACALRGAMP